MKNSAIRIAVFRACAHSQTLWNGGNSAKAATKPSQSGGGTAHCCNAERSPAGSSKTAN